MADLQTKRLLLFCLVASFIALLSQCKNRNTVGTRPDFINAESSSDKSGNTVLEDYYDEDHIRYENHIYKEGIKTVLLYNEGWELSQPVIRLNKNDRLRLSFDNLDSVLTNYSYSFIHCNSDWQPSDLSYSEYINGLSEDFINDYGYSRNTYQRYINYTVEFPNTNIKFTKSGNYIIKVWVSGDANDIVLTQRFMVAEDRINIEANIHRATRNSDRFLKQEVDFSIFYNTYPVTNPFIDLKVILLQNYRWDNSVTGLKPVFAKDGELQYDYDDKNVFNGGNEFRNFDIKDLRYRSPNIDRIEQQSRSTDIYLIPDKSRAYKVYLDQQDINGQRLIKVSRPGINSSIDADYANVHFRLEYPDVLTKGDIYVFGALTNWTLMKEAKMKYNYDSRAYETTLYLKQGYYNYEYVLAKDGVTPADESFIEGSHSQTENAYTILVYHRGIGDEYDKLIGLESFKYP